MNSRSAVGIAFMGLANSAKKQMQDESLDLVQVQSHVGLLEGTETDKLSRLHQLDHMLKNLADPTNNFTQSELDMITALVDTLEDEFIPELKKQSASDQAAWNTAVQGYRLCFTHLNRRFEAPSGDIHVLASKVNNAKVKFSKCLTARSSCQTYKSTAQEVGNTLWSSMVDKNLCDQSSTCFDHLKAYMDQAEPGYWGSPDSCDDDELRHQELYCDNMTASVSACLALDQCKVDAQLPTHKGEIQDRISSRENIHFVINKVQCRLKKIKESFNSATKKKKVTAIDDSSCNNVAQEDSTDNNRSLSEVYALDLSDPTDATSHCPAPSFHPPQEDACDAWLDGEWASTKNGKSCRHTCSAPSSVDIAPGLARPECSDIQQDDSFCPFYTRHHDACGKYADNAVTNCCACGGGLTPAPTPAPTPPNGWIQILSMPNSYTPSPNAINDQNWNIVKLSDTDINAISGEADYTYFKVTYSETNPGSMIIRTAADAVYKDTADNFGISSSAVTSFCVGEEIADCTWTASGNSYLDYYPNGANDCSRVFSYNGGCYPSSTNGKRCWNQGSANCNHAVRTGVRMYKWGHSQ